MLSRLCLVLLLLSACSLMNPPLPGSKPSASPSDLLPSNTPAPQSSPSSLPTATTPLPAATETPLNEDNLLPNPGVEELDPEGNPIGWTPDSWGEEIPQLSVKSKDPFSGQHYLSVSILNYLSGDAKWIFDPQNLKSDTWYEYADEHRSDGRSRLILACTPDTGARRYYTIGQSHVADDWQAVQTRFYLSPADPCKVSIMHVLDREGWLETDHHRLHAVEAHPLKRPLVSISFDDVWATAAGVGAAELEKHGWHGSYYAAGKFTRSGDANYLNPEGIKTLLKAGHEVGSHSINHQFLSQLGPTDLINDLQDQRQYLEWLGAKVQGIAYPFGDFDAEVETETKRFYGYARTSLVGLNEKDVNPYRLRIFPVTTDNTTAELKRWVDDAQRTSTWLIFLFHDLGDTPLDAEYTTPISQYKEVLDYIASKNLTVKTVAEALKEVQAQ